jgi:hypothetical protein
LEVWREFQSAVDKLNEKSTPREVLGIMLAWLRSRHDFFTKQPFCNYGFAQIMKMKEESLPVEYSRLDILHFKKIILSYDYASAKNVESIAGFLRDSIEELVTLEVEKQCPNCESWDMVFYVGKYNGLLAYVCRVCGHSRYLDGSKVGTDELDFVYNNKLKEVGMI